MEKKIIWIIFLLLTKQYFLYADAVSIQRYFWANYQRFRGENITAEQWFSRLYSERVPKAAYVGYINFLFSIKQFARIYDLRHIIETDFSMNIPLQLILADVLSLYKEEHGLDERLLLLHQEHPENPELTLRVTQILMEKKDLDNALCRIDAFLNKARRSPQLFLFHFTKAQIFLQCNKNPEALASVLESISIFPYFDKSFLMLGVLYEQFGNIAEALEAYKQFVLLTTSPSKQLEQRLVMLTLEEKKIHDMVPKEDHESLYVIAEKLYAEKEYSDAMRYITAYLKYETFSEKGKQLKVSILIKQNLYVQAIEVLKTFLLHNSDNVWWEQTLHGLGTEHGMEYLVASFFKKLAKKNNNEHAYLLAADLFLRVDNTFEALQCLDCVSVSTEVSFQKALIHFEIGKFDSTKKILEEALLKDQNCHYIINFLAYLYAKKDKDYVKASEFITNALRLCPTNVAYLDTYAFILYKQQKFHEAEKISSVLFAKNTNPYIVLHHAKILYKQKKYASTQETLKHIFDNFSDVHFFVAKAEKLKKQMLLHQME